MRRTFFTALLLAVAVTGAVYGQGWTGGGGEMWRGWRGERPRFATAAIADGNFHFCRLMYPSLYREAGGSGWRTDYPGADINFSIRFAELTKTAVSRDGEGDPEYFVVRSSEDDNLFRCPYVHIEDAGTAGFSAADVEQLRKYLLKGGFMWSDDFWGDAAWDNWETQIARVLPPGRYPIVDLAATHPAFQTIYNVKQILQVPAIQPVAPIGRADVRAGIGERAGEHAGYLRREGPAPRPDDAQHRHLGHVGARRRRPGVFLSLLARGVRDRDKCDDVRAHALVRARGLQGS